MLARAPMARCLSIVRSRNSTELAGRIELVLWHGGFLRLTIRFRRAGSSTTADNCSQRYAFICCFLLCLVTLWMRPIGTDVSSSMVSLCVRVGLTAYIVQKTRLSIS